MFDELQAVPDVATQAYSGVYQHAHFYRVFSGLAGGRDWSMLRASAPQRYLKYGWKLRLRSYYRGTLHV